MTDSSPRLLDRLRTALRVRHYSLRTEETYVQWVRRYVTFHGRRHPADLGAAEVTAFLSHLAVDRSVAPATQSQAKSALLFLYRDVLEQDLPWLDEIVKAKPRQRLPVTLTPSEVGNLLERMNGQTGLIASLLYGTGMRLLEGLRLRVKDVEFERREIIVRDGKGGKDRVTVLPENLVLPLQGQLASSARSIVDVGKGFGAVWLPDALATKYPRRPRPGAGNGSSPQLAPPIRAPASLGITCTSDPTRWYGAARHAGSASLARRMCCAIRLRRTCFRPGTTSARCRSCWVMPTSARR